MRKYLDIVAKIISVVLYPLFIPTYGIGLFCYAHKIHIAPLNVLWIVMAIIGTFLFTCVIPVTAIWIMKKRGEIKNLYMEDSRERTMPYLYAVVGFAFWSYLLVSILHAPLFLSYIAIGATVSIGLVALINRWWKISAHMIGCGGLVGGLFCYCLGLNAIPTWSTFGGWFGLSLLLMWARLRLDAHTPAQVCAGWLLGLTCTFLPYCIYAYVA